MDHYGCVELHSVDTDTPTNYVVLSSSLPLSLSSKIVGDASYGLKPFIVSSHFCDPSEPRTLDPKVFVEVRIKRTSRTHTHRCTVDVVQ